MVRRKRGEGCLYIGLRENSGYNLTMVKSYLSESLAHLKGKDKDQQQFHAAITILFPTQLLRVRFLICPFFD